MCFSSNTSAPEDAETLADTERSHCKPAEPIQFDGMNPGLPHHSAPRNDDQAAENYDFED
jgi:hypothetical protein